MKRTGMFFVLTLVLGWIFQALILYAVPAGLPTPQWLLLAVLALGAQGRTTFAMSAGFIWGLALDAYGISAFGVQGWLLALAGFGSGTLSKNLNAEKLGTQETLAVIATLVMWGGIRILSGIFDHSPVGHPSVILATAHVALNALVAPGVFWVMAAWSDLWDPRPRNDHA
ncbi:MAG: rod shape-determining protein MreD [Elusimicrobia bacterium]|nr:rod shape-determining protein MreD [Elusimicrobiota bacterium]